MPIAFHLSGTLRGLAGGRERVEIGAGPMTLGDAFEALWAVVPALRDRVVTEEGEIREHVNVFVGQENVRYTGGRATPVSEEAEISIFPALSGGCDRGARGWWSVPAAAWLLTFYRDHRYLS